MHSGWSIPEFFMGGGGLGGVEGGKAEEKEAAVAAVAVRCCARTAWGDGHRMLSHVDDGCDSSRLEFDEKLASQKTPCTGPFQNYFEMQTIH